MSSVDTRNIPRDSLFLMADVRVDGRDEGDRVKVRNLSAGGMMADGAVGVVRGSPISVNLRGVGWVDGVVAWVQDHRFGIAFGREIDPKLARAPVSVNNGPSTPRFVRSEVLHPDPRSRPTTGLRKI